MIVAVSERRAYFTRCMRCGLRGSSRGITIEPGRTEWVDEPTSFDTRVAPPRADEQRDEDLRLSLSGPFIDLLQ